jgi:AcrR family transcriptional regulator
MSTQATQTKLKPPIRREKPAFRREQILEAALRRAALVGAQGLTRDQIAEEVGLCTALLSRYFGCMDLLRDLVIETAFKRLNTSVLYKSLSIEDFKRLNTNPALTEQLCRYLRS